MRFVIDRTGAESLSAGFPLPASARPARVGVTLDRTLRRAVGTNEWFVAGDGRAVPRPYALEFTVAAGNEASARAFLDALFEASERARGLVRSAPAGGARFGTGALGLAAFGTPPRAPATYGSARVGDAVLGEEHRLPLDGLVSVSVRFERADVLEVSVELAARGGFWTDAAGTGRHVM